MIPRSSIASLLDGVEVVDRGTGPTVALAHGAGGGVTENFQPLVDAAPDRFRFVGPSYPGSGSTPTPDEPLELEQLADLVVAAGLRTGADRFPVVGISLGAAVATTAVVRHPEHVSALVLTVGLARTDAQSLSFTRLWRRLADRDDLEGIASLMLLTAGTDRDLQAVTDADDLGTVLSRLARDYSPGSVAHAELAQRVDVTGLLPRVEVPTLVVVAGRDRIVLPETARLFGAIPGARTIELPEAGHIFDPSHAARWSDEVLGFLDER